MAASYTGISSVVDVGGNELTSLGYYGGRAQADGFPDFTVSLDEYARLLEDSVRKFLQLVDLGNPELFKNLLPVDSGTTIKLENSFEAGVMELKIEIDGTPKLEETVTFDLEAKTVTVHRPDDFDIEWQAYLVWNQALKSFVALAKIISGKNA